MISFPQHLPQIANDKEAIDRWIEPNNRYLEEESRGEERRRVLLPLSLVSRRHY